MSDLLTAARIAKRVAERNSWPTYVVPSLQEMSNFFLGTSAPIPSKAVLDKEFPVQPVDYNLLRFPKSDLQVTWVGHSTLLIQLHRHVNILTDPIFSERCSALQFAGPKGIRPPALTVKDLVRERIPIHMVTISHNHYDHLDYRSLSALTESNDSSAEKIQFVVPLGLRAWMEKNIPKAVTHHSTIELDWDETININFSQKITLDISAVPMQHWSSRLGWDKDKSLWCGYSICSTIDKDVTTLRKVLFPGDTGWFEGLHEIGKRYGPFDLAAIPIGAYEPRNFMKANHINPEEAVRMMEAVKAQRAIPIHWGTFPLSFESVFEPREQLIQASKDAKLKEGSFSPCLIGETVCISDS